MRRVLITGAGSYVGTKVRERLELEPGEFSVEELDVRGDAWRAHDFSGYDCVYHVAGIAHVSADPGMEPLYMAVNRDLAVEVGRKAKEAGVPQLIFMSSAIVYGDADPCDVFRPITRDTPINPSNYYGLSKAEAEIGLMELVDGSFKVAILRCPMIYGPGCKGNFPRLAKIARVAPAFPDIENRRSMLYVGNLAELVAVLARSGAGGLYLPQNAEWSSTPRLVEALAAAQGRKVRLTKALNPAAKALFGGTEAFSKAFGNLYYEQGDSDAELGYQRYSLRESVGLCVSHEEDEMHEARNRPCILRGRNSSLASDAKADGVDEEFESEAPLLSLTTVTFNSEKTLARTIESVLRQSYRPLEYTIMDGNSTDDTVGLALSFCGEFARAGIRFHVYSESDSGMYDAINKAMNLSTGEVIGNVNSDDYLEDGASETVMGRYLEHGFEVFQGSVRIHSPKGTFVKRAAPMGPWENTRGFNHPALFLAGRARDLRYRTDSPYADFDLFLRAQGCGMNTVYDAEVLSNFFFGGISTGGSVRDVVRRIGWRYRILGDNDASPVAYVEAVLAEVAKSLGA